ncbi:O-acetyltransferase -1 [Hyphodiscus hymeniophilus]|uniref:O-acetyltransferase -1 n=1 Tax=Hyphodiscus hymeniophilus TaxID=353542 RepID=A0A9P7AYU3_9HELO|nr:O-acetyltransferase -1 [Hyphodiscus hymeniophilus]
MIKDYRPRVIWHILDTDNPPQIPDHKIFVGSGKRLLQKLAFGLIPSFVQRKLHQNPSKSNKLHPTAYLDGLRGVASFIVFMGHYTEETLGWYTEPYGAYEDGAPSSLLQLPFVRVLYSPRPMVHIFFIISGYVLAYKPLKQIHSQQLSALTITLSSSVFRRALRLFLPSLITMFVMALAVHFDLSDDRFAPSFFTLSDQMSHWWDTCWGLLRASWAVNDLSYPQPEYNPALWTIPVEFAQSMILFITIIGLSRCITIVRFLMLASIIAFCFFGGQLFTVEFLGGMFIAELTLLQDGSLFTPTSSPTLLPKYDSEELRHKIKECPRIRHYGTKAFWIMNVICGLFIASWTNNHANEVWGIRFFDAHTPEPYHGQQVWFCLGAFQIVGALTQLKFLQTIFNTPIPQYLGNISYALYLVHNLCLTIMEPRVNPYFYRYFGNTTSLGRHLTWVGGLAVYLPVIICVADIFWRAVDTPTVKFARWLEAKCIMTPKKT